ncbi:ferric reductase-like transmembrane domain-containing protein [Actinocrispum sp. NPDC049592]|uniref:ferric reductase-like transmembrane domain-containing protein n=1 Tax=Actinocrispum sp. NPDC049592 TaxID=3154835 RepID=UPI003428F172
MSGTQTLILAVGGPSDDGLRGVAAVAARVSYAMLCLTISWGVLTRTGWARRVGERKTFRSGHLVLATLTIAFGIVHALGFLFLSDGKFTFGMIAIPIQPEFRYTIAIVGLELMMAIAITASLYRWTSYRRWQYVHRMAYIAFLLLVAHSVLGAMANNHLSILWLAGLTFFIPAITLAILRFVPTRTLVQIGLVEEQA